ncbi:phosphotransferase family protein [Nonomuraea sp. H19]|uniref:phosphotransferase family protein n=1 Tax=Nonomuraea sp. H19 TaxID=3452206 RepID=UPI003F8C2DD9
MTSDIRTLLARHLPGYQIRTISRLGHGLDNLVYEVNDELVVRRSKAADPQTTRQEVARLAAVRELSPLPVPDMVFADEESGVIAYRKLPGDPLGQHPVRDPKRLAEQLGRFLTALHTASEELRELAPRDVYPAPTQLHDAELDYRDIEDHVPRSERPLVERFLRTPPPAEPPALRFCHNDLGSEHVLVDAETSTITGIIDWTDAAITDPAHDFALIYRDLGPEVFDLTVSHYAFDLDEEDRARVLFHARCKLIEDLAYGLSSGPRHYADAALSHLAWTFS